MRVALTIDKVVGYRYLVADAIDAGASGFYTKFGFFALPDSDFLLCRFLTTTSFLAEWF